jgi:hypothetical protein
LSVSDSSMWADDKSAHIVFAGHPQAIWGLLVLKRALNVINLAFTVYGDPERAAEPSHF